MNGFFNKNSDVIFCKKVRYFKKIRTLTLNQIIVVFHGRIQCIGASLPLFPCLVEKTVINLTNNIGKYHFLIRFVKALILNIFVHENDSN